METAGIRQKLHQCIDESDEKLLKLMYALAMEYNADNDFEYDFTEEDMKFFDERREKHLRSKSKTYPWQEAKDKVLRPNVE